MMRVKNNPADIGRCGCGRREYCDGSHALSAEQWRVVQERERAEAEKNPPSAATEGADGSMSPRA